MWSMLPNEAMYPYTAKEARDRGELEVWRANFRTNCACAGAIELAIHRDFDGMHLKDGCAKSVIDQYGYRRVQADVPEQPLDVAVAALKQEKRLYRQELQRWERETPGSQMLLAGTCDQCETCEKVQGHPCGRPELLRYSIEALGGDVEGCLQHYFHLPMLWGRDGKAPDYFVLVGGLLTK